MVIATRNRGAKIVPLLESILANEAPSFELVIVDQSALDDTAEAVQPFLTDPRFRYVRSTSVGLSCSRNEGIALTTAPIIAITDDDCIVPENWLAGMAAPFDKHARVGMVFCTVKAVPVDRPGLTPAITFPHDQILRDPLSSWKWSVGGLNLGAGMAVRRTAFDELLGYDELLGAGARFGSCEDNDMSWRGLIAGWWTYQTSEVVVMHDGFRDLDELRELVKRDFYGVGGAIAKYLRTGQWGITWFMMGWLIRFGVIDPAREVFAGRKPKGFRRPYMLLRGLFAGFRTPIDRKHRLYVVNSQLAR